MKYHTLALIIFLFCLGVAPSLAAGDQQPQLAPSTTPASGILPTFLISCAGAYQLPQGATPPALGSSATINQTVNVIWQNNNSNFYTENVEQQSGPLTWTTSGPLQGYVFNYTPNATNPAFDAPQAVYQFMAQDRSSYSIVQASPPPAIGSVEVQIVDSTTGRPVAGATITMQHDGGGGAVTYPMGGGTIVYLGLDPTRTVVGPCAPGLEYDTYDLLANAPGYQSTYAYVASGVNLLGTKVTFKISSSTTTSPSNTTEDAAPPSSGTSTVTDTTDFGGLETFFTNLFAVNQSDLTSLQAAFAKLYNYGPLSIPGQITAIWQQTMDNPINGDGSAPGYWVIPLSLGYFTQNQNILNSNLNQTSVPLGYTQPLPVNGPQSTVASTLIPTQIDLTLYARPLMDARTVGCWLCWGFVGFMLIKRFMPEPKL